MSGQVSFCLLAATAWTIDYLNVWGWGPLWCLCVHASHWLRSDCRPSEGWRGQTTYAWLSPAVCLSVGLKFSLSDLKLRFIGWKREIRHTRLKLNTRIQTHLLWTLSYFRCYEKVSASFCVFWMFRYPGVSVHTHIKHNLLPIYEVIHEVLKVHGGVIRGEISVCAWVTVWKQLQLTVWSSKLQALTYLIQLECLSGSSYTTDPTVLPNFCSNDSQLWHSLIPKQVGDGHYSGLKKMTAKKRLDTEFQKVLNTFISWLGWTWNSCYWIYRRYSVM